MLKSKKSPERDQQFLTLIMKLYKHATFLTLTKLAYLTDLLSHEKTGKRLSGFAYKLLSFGPFDPAIYDDLEKLIASDVIRSCLNYSSTGLEYVTYVFNDVIDDLEFRHEYLPDISLVEFYLAEDILYQFFLYSESQLTDMVFNSKPVRALGITGPGLSCDRILSF